VKVVWQIHPSSVKSKIKAVSEQFRLSGSSVRPHPSLEAPNAKGRCKARNRSGIAHPPLNEKGECDRAAGLARSDMDGVRGRLYPTNEPGDTPGFAISPTREMDVNTLDTPDVEGSGD
jgi:hypothetical protein